MLRSLLRVRSVSMEAIGFPRDRSNDHLNAFNNALFHICWRRQSCSYCLAGDVPCSWCAISSTCVPNEARVPILAPLGSKEICPLGSKERWELRALPFGCYVSTFTVLSVLGTVLGMLLSVVLWHFTMWLVNQIRQRYKHTQSEHMDQPNHTRRGVLGLGWLLSLGGIFSPGQMQGGSLTSTDDAHAAERRPLLE